MNIKIFGIVFAVLSTISLLSAVTLFLAGTSVFLFVQLFEYYANQGAFWAAFLITLPGIPLFAYLFFALIKKLFSSVLIKEEEDKKPQVPQKALVSSLFLAYEIFKIFVKRKNR